MSILGTSKEKHITVSRGIHGFIVYDGVDTHHYAPRRAYSTIQEAVKAITALLEPKEKKDE